MFKVCNCLPLLIVTRMHLYLDLYHIHLFNTIIVQLNKPSILKMSCIGTIGSCGFNITDYIVIFLVSIHYIC